MTFRSTRVEETGVDCWKVIGNLTVRDVTKEVVLGTEFQGLLPTSDNSRHAKFSAAATLDRRDFGLGLHGPGVIVGDRVSVSLQISAVSSSDA